MRKELLTLLFLTIIGCGPSKEEIATTKESIAKLEIEVSDLNDKLSLYETQQANVDSVRDRVNNLNTKLTNTNEGSDERIEIESMIEGANKRIKVEEKRLLELNIDYERILKLKDAKFEKMKVLSKKINGHEY